MRAAKKGYHGARLYAAPIVVMAWAVLVELVASSLQLVVIRLVSVAVALVFSIRELNARRHD